MAPSCGSAAECSTLGPAGAAHSHSKGPFRMPCSEGLADGRDDGHGLDQLVCYRWLLHRLFGGLGDLAGEAAPPPPPGEEAAASPGSSRVTPNRIIHKSSPSGRRGSGGGHAERH